MIYFCLLNSLAFQLKLQKRHLIKTFLVSLQFFRNGPEWLIDVGYQPQFALERFDPETDTTNQIELQIQLYFHLNSFFEQLTALYIELEDFL